MTSTETDGLQLIRQAISHAWSKYNCHGGFSPSALVILRELNDAVTAYEFTNRDIFDHRFRPQIRLAQRVLRD